MTGSDERSTGSDEETTGPAEDSAEPTADLSVDATEVEPAPPDPRLPDDVSRRVLLLDRRNIWGVAWTIVGVILLVQVLLFVLGRGESFLFTLFLAWLAAVAMEPAVGKLSNYVPRGAATAIVMASLVAAAITFLVLFGQLLAGQIVRLIDQVPAWTETIVAWLNDRFDADIELSSILDSVGLTTDWLGDSAMELAGGVVGFLSAIVSSFFNVFLFGFFLFFFSADGPRLRMWIARLFPPGRQKVIGTVWDLAIQKTGGYVSARVILALLSSTASAIFLLIIGMDYWLALAIWIGVVSQFVPTVGTYLAITLPALIGVISSSPMRGLAVVIFAVAYQQVENLLFEPRISGNAVGVHPAVSLGAVILGTALIGVSGAFIAVPIAALLVALLEIYARQYEVLPEYAEMRPAKKKSLGTRLRGIFTRRKAAAPE